jgi:predicted nucleic acid-binding protein
MGLEVIGILGLLKTAREQGHIAALRPVLEELELKKFRIGDKLREALLAEVGESRNPDEIESKHG